MMSAIKLLHVWLSGGYPLAYEEEARAWEVKVKEP